MASKNSRKRTECLSKDKASVNCVCVCVYAFFFSSISAELMLMWFIEIQEQMNVKGKTQF